MVLAATGSGATGSAATGSAAKNSRPIGLITFLTNQPDQPKPTNSTKFQLMCFSSNVDKIWYGG